jgi:hypothetical protein
MLGKSGIQFAGALALVALLGLPSAEAGLKQLEIKGNIAFSGHAVDFGTTTDSGVLLDADLDFKMKFSQDVSARIDLEMDDAVAGDDLWTGKAPASAMSVGNRFNIGVDQAFFKLNDFLFRNFNLTIGKQNMNVSLRDNKSMSWAFGDPIAVVGSYATRDMDIKGYMLKLTEEKLGTTTSVGTGPSNNGDETVIGSYVEYWLNDDSLVAGYVNYKSEKDAAQGGIYDNLVHYGIGLDYFIGESLEVYGEVAGQSISDSTGANDGSAFQLTLGGEYAFTDYDMKPVLGLEYYLQSGADASSPAWQTVAGGLASADTDSIYTEANGIVGRDINPGLGVVSKGMSTGVGGGYSVIRLNGAISPTKATKVGLGLHFFTDEDSTAATLNNNDDDLGTELDLYSSWKYSQDVTFRAGLYLVSNPNHAAAVNEGDITGVAISSALTF